MKAPGSEEEELPVLLRPRHIYRLWPSITPALLRKWRLAGQVKYVQYEQNSHPFYFTLGIKKALGIHVETPIFRSEKPTLFAPLLRLRDVVDLLGLSRDVVEDLVLRRRIKPFYKAKHAKALYRTWQFRLPKIQIRSTPAIKSLRRREVIDWLGLPDAEIESWEGVRWIRRRKGYYNRDEIARKILALPNPQNASKTRS